MVDSLKFFIKCTNLSGSGSAVESSVDHLSKSYLADFHRIVVGIDERLPALDQDEHR